MNQNKISTIIRKRYKALAEKQQEIFDQVESYRQMYHSFMEKDDSYPWDYQLVDPQIFPLLRAYLARLNPAEARVLLSGNDSRIREINQKIINWELNEVLLTQIFYRLMFSGFIAGKGYLKTGWKYEPAVKIKTKNGNISMREIINRADVRNVRFVDMFIPNTNNPDLLEQPYLIERISMTYGEMLDQNKGEDVWVPKYLEKIKEKEMFDDKVEYGADIPEDEEIGKEELVLRSQNVKMLCMHTKDGGKFYTLEDESNNDWILNKKTENEYWHGHYPYIDFTPFPEDDSFFTMGIVQPNADLQIAMSSVLNQLLTNARKAGNPMWIAGQSAAQTPDWQFVNRPDGIIRVVGDVNQVQPVRIPDTSNTLVNLRQELQVAFERGTSLSSFYTSGVSSTPQINKTATGARIINDNISENLGLLISLFGEQVLKRLGEHFLELNPQYITEEQTFAITGKNGESELIRVRPEEISANFKVVASAERMLKQSPTTRQAGLINVFTTLSAAKRDGAPINLKPVAEVLVDAFPETEMIDDIIIDPAKKAEEVISSIMRGFDPVPPTYDDDHKILMSIVQKFMYENPTMDDAALTRFKDYIQDLQSWMQAKQNNLVPPRNAPPDLMPLDATALQRSLDSQSQPDNIMGANLPIPITPTGLGM